MFLSMLVITAWQYFFVPPPNQVQPVTTEKIGLPEDLPSESSSTTPPPAEAFGRMASTVDPVSPVRSVVDIATSDPVVSDTEEREVLVESDLFRAVFSNRGAELISWQLKAHREDDVLIDLVPRDLPLDEPRAFGIAFFDQPDLTQIAKEALFKANITQLKLQDRAETVVFDYEDANGLRLRKTFLFNPSISPYVVTVSVEAHQGQQTLKPILRWGPALGGVERSSGGISYKEGPRGILYGRVLEAGIFQETDMTRPDRSDIDEQSTYEGQMLYAGVDNHYFLAAALPASRLGTIDYRNVSLPNPDLDDRALLAFDLALEDGIDELAFYLGPKEFNVLESAGNSLQLAIDFGFFAALIVPLHRSLTWVYETVGNWGIAIILLTIVINLIMFPLRHKSVMSMRKMQELQPQMKAIQDRYKHLKATDPEKQKMNKEVMALYTEKGVNPISGCLPMLLTMPVLFAFYRLLSLSIEMRGAPFLGWITDLSAQDPYYVTPIVMGASMVLQQRLTPSQAEPMQQKIMMLMPVIFTFMFLSAPSGLVIYWLTSNLWGIGQQLITYQLTGPLKTSAVRPPAEGRAKKSDRKRKAKKKLRTQRSNQNN